VTAGYDIADIGCQVGLVAGKLGEGAVVVVPAAENQLDQTEVAVILDLAADVIQEINRNPADS
jgi:hypothetical protein